MALTHDTVTLLRLTAFQRECQSHGLPLECAMAQVVRHAVRFAHAFDSGPRQSWAGHFGSLKQEMKLFKEALRKEFPDIKGNPNGDGQPMENSAESDFVELTCPFCAEKEFDAIGLKHHLLNGWCDVFEQTSPVVAEIVGSPFTAVEKSPSYSSGTAPAKESGTAEAGHPHEKSAQCDHDPMSHGSTLECDSRGALKCSNCTELDGPAVETSVCQCNHHFVSSIDDPQPICIDCGETDHG